MDANNISATSPKSKYLRRWSALESERSSWRSHWMELSDYIAPRRGRFLLQEGLKGRKRNTKIIDSTSIIALRTLASGMMSGLTSPARPWFRLATPDREQMEYGPVRDWLDAVEQKIYYILTKSNFYNSIFNVYVELGAFGTAALWREPDFKRVVNYKPLTAGEYALAEGESGEVDTIYREFAMSVGQIVEKFGIDPEGKKINWDNISQSVKNLWDRGNYDTWIDVMHSVEPRRDRYYSKRDGKNKPFKSCYFELGGDDDKMLGEGGFDRFPAYTPRWDVLGGDVYGRSPGMDALGDVKQLQQQQRRKAEGIDKMVNPPMTAPVSLKGKTATVLPGGVTFVDQTQGQQGFVPTYLVQPRINELMLDIQDVQARINRVFYADIFAATLQSDRRNVTATEIAERHEEKLILLGPVLQRLNTELFDPLIDDVFTFAFEAGLIPEPPEEIADTDLKVEYISILAQAQQAVGAASIERTLGFVGNLAAANPEVLDKIDFDQAVDEYSSVLGTPSSIIRSDDAVAELRAGRAKANQMAQQQQMIAQSAQTAKVLSETDTQNPNALTAILQGGY